MFLQVKQVMVMLKVTSFKICPFFQQVLAVLNVFDIPFEVEYTDFDSCRFDISPNGKAPILTTDSGKVLFDSDAIIDYLLVNHVNITSNRTAEDNAVLRGWAFQASKNYVAQCSAMRSESKESFESLAETFKSSLVKVESVLGDSTYFDGETPGLVDASWTPLLHRAFIIKKYTGYDFFEQYPKVSKWQQAVLASGLAEQSVSEDFEGVFKAFYLSDKSWLGSLTS